MIQLFPIPPQPPFEGEWVGILWKRGRARVSLLTRALHFRGNPFKGVGGLKRATEFILARRHGELWISRSEVDRALEFLRLREAAKRREGHRCPLCRALHAWPPEDS